VTTVIEVGANTGTDTENFLSDPNTIVYAFEPVPELVNHLYNKFRGIDRFHLMPMAIDIEITFKMFNVATDVGCSSLYNFSDDIYQQWEGREGHFNVATSYKVPTTRLDTFMNDYNIGQVDYLWIDAQGNDFNVLKSLGDRIADIKEGKCEGAYTVDLYKNTDNHVGVITPWLESKGFSCTLVPDAVGKEADIHFKRI